ncbi:MAG: CHASE domain-containing protein [Novosphingobium sp.]|nr:CHASE domain-containing protein [Novosphingobium sp.]
MMDRALLARVRQQAWFHKYPRGLPFLLLAITLFGTVLSVMAIERADTQREQLELDRNFTEIASALQRRAAEHIAVLRASASLFATSENVTHQEFTDFASDLLEANYQRGSLGLGWARWLDVNAVPGFEAGIRESEGPQFVVHPLPQPGQNISVPIVYLEPLSVANRRAIGYDMYSETVRREAMDRAIRLERPVASGKVHLVQDLDDPGAAGFLIYMPVLEQTGARRYIKGFVYSPFRADEFVESAAKLFRNRPVEIAIYDGKEEPEDLLAWRKLPGENNLSMARRIKVGDRDWILRVSSKRESVLSPVALATLFFGTILAVLLMIVGMLITNRAAEDRQVLEWLQRQSAIRNSLTRELNHRVKNTLANVLSIVSLTRRRSKDIDEFAENLTGRIRALSATHDLLSQSNWTDALLGEVISNELAPYLQGSEQHVEMSGPQVRLAPNDAMSLGLAIHELATNAAKYGALSCDEGRIVVEWQMLSPELVEVSWREEGGPPVSPPSRRGFGRDLIEKVVAHELQSQVDLQFNPGGVECTLRVPVRKPLTFALRQSEKNETAD